MKTLANFLSSLIIAFWLITIAVFSIQNIQLVSLKFLSLESIKLPLGVMLTFSLAFGFLLSAILPCLLPSSKK